MPSKRREYKWKMSIEFAKKINIEMLKQRVCKTNTSR